MPPKVPPGIRISPKGYIPNLGKRANAPRPENISLDKNPDIINGVATKTHGRGIRNTQFRLPYLSNLRKMDPIFDDPYEVAAQTIRKTRQPGDPDVVLDPDGLYEENDGEGDEGHALEEGLPSNMTPEDKFANFEEVERYRSLMAATGISMEYIHSLMQRPLIMKFVSNQIRTGKTRSAYCLTVVGNGNGMVGFGEGKSEETTAANTMALIQAIRNMVPVMRYENRTVYGDIESKFVASRVYLRARPPGFGIRANYYVHEICRCAGITDVGAKVRGSMNGMNIVKATFQALQQQKLPSTIAKQRGVHVIDVRERYFHGR
jgi:small subunit ribosomal protein S5